MRFLEFWLERCHKMSIDDTAAEMDRLCGLVKTTPWVLSFHDRGMGHGDWGINCKLHNMGVLIFEAPDRDIAEHIIDVHNQSLKLVVKKTKGKK